MVWFLIYWLVCAIIMTAMWIQQPSRGGETDLAVLIILWLLSPIATPAALMVGLKISVRKGTKDE